MKITLLYYRVIDNSVPFQPNPGKVQIAKLLLSTMLGHDLGHTFGEDFPYLASVASCSIVLEHRQVEFIDGSSLSRRIELIRRIERPFGRHD